MSSNSPKRNSYSIEGFLSSGSSQVSPADLTGAKGAVAAMPPIELKNAENPSEEASPAAIPSPRKSRVVGLLPKGLIINSLKPEAPPEGSPSPRPDAKELLSSFTQLELACDGVEDVIESMAEALS